MTLAELGPRICVLGASGAGKSTLAQAISRARGLAAIHLDQYRHLLGTHWRERPDEEFAALHAEAITQERWVMDGNYGRLLPARLERATGVILIDGTVAQSIRRHVWRTVHGRERAGGLPGTRDRLTWAPIRFQLRHGAAGRAARRDVFDRSPLPKVFLPDRRALRAFYVAEHLVRD